jgi:hypothetical protein
MLLLVLIVACKSKTTGTAEETKVPKSAFTVLKPSEADAAQSRKAYELGKRVLMTCNTSKFKAFNSSEATPSVIENTTQARLTKTCHAFRLKYGDFKDIRLVTVYRNERDKSHIYRYKAEYTKPIANKELRVTMNAENKVSSIKSADWVDNYTPQ